MARYGIVIDLNRCTGCMTCVIACKQENLTRPKIWWNKVLEIESDSLDYIHFVRYACMHCDDPPCAKACPEKAIYKRPDGIVLIDQKKCKGHGKCIPECPYGVIEKNPDKEYFPEVNPFTGQDTEAFRTHLPGKASKCTFCVHLIEQGKEPACVEGCPSKAMTFGDLDDPDSLIRNKLWKSTQLLTSSGAEAKVTYIIPRNLTDELEQRVVDNPQMNR